MILAHIIAFVSITTLGSAKIQDYPLNYDVRADMRVVEMGPTSEEDILSEGGKIEPFEPLGVDRGSNIGVGLAPGVQCIDEKPMGEDGLLYCKPDSNKNKKRRERMAEDLVVLTTRGISSDAHKRFLRSTKIFGYDIKVLSNPNGDTQLKLLREAVDKINREAPKKLVLFIDGPDVILSSGPLRVVEEFEHSEAGVLFSGDGVFTGKPELEDDFPKTEKGRRFLDAGAFVGNSESIKALLKEFSDETDLQTLMSKAYTKPALRSKHNLRIDHTSSLFQNLNGATADLELRFVGKEAYIQNTLFSSVPAVIRASNHTIPILNNFGSYIARSWNEEDGCRDCWDDMISLSELTDDELPIVTVAVFIESPTPFMEEFLQTVQNLTYPKKRIHFYLHNAMEYHKEIVETWLNEIKEEFKQVKYISPEDKSTKEWHAKNGAMDYCLESECTHVFFMDSEGLIDNPHTLKLLIEQNRQVLSPLLPRPGKAWSNYWGALTSEGFYARSSDYMEIVQNQRRGLWNVPFVGTTYLVQRALFEDPKTRPSFINNLLEADMAFCHNLRAKGIFMYVTNRVDMGHMLNSENFNPNHINPELYQLFENRWDWERRYLHVNYTQSLNASNKILSPCPDVFWFPIFTERYAKEMIELTEGFGQWSDGSHEDKRLDGGYESVPTVDIHMNQIAYHDEWLEILRAYVQPLQLRVFEGYYNDVGPPRALMAFAVRYKPDEQPSLRPHHDTSTYTINVAMNRPGIDFQGGGCRFIRYNCSVIDTKVGWMLMHPGRLTHLHEGLEVTNGTRYILITFVDP